jgi:hypothetical protein
MRYSDYQAHEALRVESARLARLRSLPRAKRPAPVRRAPTWLIDGCLLLGFAGALAWGIAGGWL